MQADVAADMSWSSALFQSQVWPLIMKSGKFGDLIQMEGRPDVELARQLDMRSGIDGWEMTLNGGMRGIAARIQKTDKSWRSFTIRMSRNNGAATEYQKRLRAITCGNGLIYPHLTVQAYARTHSGPIIEIGICKTFDLIQFIKQGNHEIKPVHNAKFAACYWDKMNEKNMEVIRVTPS